MGSSIDPSSCALFAFLRLVTFRLYPDGFQVLLLGKEKLDMALFV
jgi:hypothetical protein